MRTAQSVQVAILCDYGRIVVRQVLGLVENMGGVCCPACGQGIQLFAPNTGTMGTPVIHHRLLRTPIRFSITSTIFFL